MNATPPAAPSSVLDLAMVMPVVEVADADDAVPLARALVEGGLSAVEVSLRTEAAPEAISRVAAEVPEAVVGAGTLLSREHVRTAVGAGARFLTGPGWTERLLDAMRESGLPFLPGASTVSEVLALTELGVKEAVFFPAESAGGAGYLRSTASSLPHVRFCAAGGISASSAPDYLALPNVACVGGSWMLPDDAVAARDWARVERLAREAATLHVAG